MRVMCRVARLAFSSQILEIWHFLKWFGSEKWCLAFTLFRCQYSCGYTTISKLLTIGKFDHFLGCLALKSYLTSCLAFFSFTWQLWSCDVSVTMCHACNMSIERLVVESLLCDVVENYGTLGLRLTLQL